MQTRAAVLYAPRTPLVIEDLELEAPKEGEVLVRIASAGVCRSDWHVMQGDWTTAMPIVLGHEAAGVIEAVGSGVTLSKPGDHVILNFRPNCGWCRYCVSGRPVLCNGTDTPRWFMFDGTTRLRRGDIDVHHYARTASFSQYAVVPQTGAVVVRDEMPLDKACLIGCAVTTGVCAVLNTARVEPGASVAVIGCGGVGLSIVQGARLAGAGRIVAVDVSEGRLAYARHFGATDVLDAGSGDVAARLRDLTDGGVDYAFEAFGSAATLAQAYEATAPGGTTVAVGMAPENEALSISALSLPRTEKTIKGSWYGSARPWLDIPKLVDWYLAGRLDIDAMVTQTYSLDEINTAYAALDAAEGARGIIVF